MRNPVRQFTLFAVAFTVVLAGLAGMVRAAEDNTDDAALALVKERCTGCHGMGKATSANMDEAGWGNILANMMDQGATLNSAEYKMVLKYLVKTYGPEKPADGK